MHLLPFLLLFPPDPPQKPDPARFEKAIAAFEKQDAAKKPAEGQVVFVGSSSIVRWNLPMHFPMLDVLNRGFGGSHLSDAVHFAPRIVVKYKPRVVVLYAGDNDIAAGTTPERIASDFRDFVRIVHKDCPKTKIVFVSIKPSVARWKLWEKMDAANRSIETQCGKDERLTFLNVGSPMMRENGTPNPEFYVADGLHLSAKGYALWTSLLKPHLGK